MRTLSVATLVLLAPFGLAAPALGEKPPKWEYAELTYRTTPAREAGVDADGKEIPAVPSGVAVRWISGAGEMEAKSWAELAEKLKAPRFKKEGSAALQKIQFLNLLGSEGWELMEQQTTGPSGQMFDRGGGGFGGRDRGPGGFSPFAASTWLLKRRVP